MQTEPWLKEDFNLPAGFPFAVLEAKGLLRQPRHHVHDCLEIDYVISGGGVNYIHGREYELKPGQIYLINNRERHIALSDGSLRMKVFIFAPSLVWQNNPDNYVYLLPFYRSQFGGSNLAAAQPAAMTAAKSLSKLSSEPMTKPMNVYENLCLLLGGIEHEWLNRREGGEPLIRARLMEFLALLYCAEPVQVSAAEAISMQGEYHSIRPSVEYIHKNFMRELTLAELAGLSSLSRTYFSARFKRIMGMNLSAYIELVRINNACLLLLTTEDSVTDICYAVGFGSLSHFTQKFKERMGATPGDFRKREQERNSGQKQVNIPVER